MNTSSMKKQIVVLLVFTVISIFPRTGLAEFDFNYFDLNLTLTDIILPETSLYTFDFSFDGYLNTAVAINNLQNQELNIISGYNPELGLDIQGGELVQDGFLLLDGTLGLSVSSTETTGARAGIRAQLRMDVVPDALGRQSISRLMETQLGRQGARAGARAGMADARLMRFITRDNGGTWIRAVRAIRDTGRAEIRAMGNSEPDGILGHYGYNESGSYVWAVLDTNSKYAVGVNIDHDGDGVVNSGDNCPYLANSDQIDTDQDGEGNACDNDDDNDEVPDNSDNCPLTENNDQDDFDNDGAGDECDLDDDNDGINDGLDQCLGTLETDLVNAEGCSIDDLCACSNAWKNHGAYVKCVAQTSEDFVDAGLISEEEKDTIVSDAAQSTCGKK